MTLEQLHRVAADEKLALTGSPNREILRERTFVVADRFLRSPSPKDLTTGTHAEVAPNVVSGG
jgi:hypothetical protein